MKLSNRKIKKQLSREGEQLFREKKADIISEEFLREVRRELPPSSLPQKSPFPFKKVLATAASFVLVLAIVLSLPLFTPAAQPPVTRPGTEQVATDEKKGSTTENDEGKETIPVPSKPSEGNAHFDIGSTYWNTPYAIVEIEEIVKRSPASPKSSTNCENIEAKCKVLFSHVPAWFEEEVDWTVDPPVPEKVMDFNDVKMFHFTVNRLSPLSPGDVIFFQVNKVHDEFHASRIHPNTNRESELLFVKDGKLEITFVDFQKWAFEALSKMNQMIEDNLEAIEKGRQPDLYLPKVPIQNGMTVDEIKEWFSKWKAKGEASNKYLEEARKQGIML